jgi:hypothetical protein
MRLVFISSVIATTELRITSAVKASIFALLGISNGISQISNRNKPWTTFAETENLDSDIYLANHVLSFIEGTPRAPSSDNIFFLKTLRLCERYSELLVAA